MICPEDREIWRPVPEPGYEDHYEVSNYGRVRRTKSGMGAKVGRILKAAFGNKRTAHRVIILSANCIERPFWVHRLVLGAFSGPGDGKECRHLNGIADDNFWLNLVWGTRKENQADRLRHGTEMRGEKSPRAKLTETEAREILRLYHNGVSASDIARGYPHVHLTTVRDIVFDKTWRHLKYGTKNTSEGTA